MPPNYQAPAPRLGWAIGGLILATCLVYLNSLTGPFVFDDQSAILENPTIRRLGSLGDVLSPHLDGGLTISGRPVVNLSLALNYAWGGYGVMGYHLFNLLVHGLAGLTLFGLLRRTLAGRLPSSPLAGAPGNRFAGTRWSENALGLAFFTTLLWLVHPLQTSAVTYVVQRAELLMALCYLLTLYSFLRGVSAVHPGRWLILSWCACLVGMACKEVMATAPLMVLVYDRIFVAGSFAEAWARRRRYYLGLASSWLWLAYLVIGTAGRGGTAGFGTEVSVWHYSLTQAWAVVHYAGLALWPNPLIFDYGTATITSAATVWWQLLLLSILVGATIVALVRRAVGGFMGVWFFLILAPSSSLVPVASQTMAEHRMYLSLAALMLLIVAVLFAWLGRRAWLVCGILAAASGGLTLRRNADYRSEQRLWADTVAKNPANGRAHNNLGKAIFSAGRSAEALGHYEEAIRLQPKGAEPHYNLGLALAHLDRFAEAIREYQTALRLQPNYAAAHNNLGNAWLATGRWAEASEQYEAAVRINPLFAEARSNLSNVRLEQGRIAEAIEQGEQAIQLEAHHPTAHYNLGNALAQAGRLAAALEQYEAALRWRPDFAEANNNRGNVLVELERWLEAVKAYERALQLQPNYPDARRNVAQVLAQLGRVPEAIAHYQVLVQLLPHDEKARAELAQLQALPPP